MRLKSNKYKLLLKNLHFYLKNNFKSISCSSFKINSTPLKTKVLYRFLYLLLAVLLVSFSDPYTIKRISDPNFRYEFYTTDKKVNPKKNKIYFWFKGGLIHNSQAGIVGELLHDKFVKMYHSNQLAEQGQFKNGLKVGFWKTWYPNGVIQTTQYWKNGLKSGKYFRYSENGIITARGNYNGGIMNGKWIDYEKKDTLTYKRGAVFIKKTKLSRVEKFKLKQESNKADRAKKTLQESEELKNASILATYKATAKENEKTWKESKKAVKETEKAKRAAKGDSKIKIFFKKLFGKKQPKQKNHGKSS